MRINLIDVLAIAVSVASILHAQRSRAADVGWIADAATATKRRPTSIGTNGAARRSATIRPSATTFPPNGKSASSITAPASGIQVDAKNIKWVSRSSARRPTATRWSPAARSSSARTTAAAGSSAIRPDVDLGCLLASTSRTASSSGSTAAKSCPPAACTTGRCRASAAPRWSKATAVVRHQPRRSPLPRHRRLSRRRERRRIKNEEESSSQARANSPTT